jgi:hypothetical protein
MGNLPDGFKLPMSAIIILQSGTAIQQPSKNFSFAGFFSDWLFFTFGDKGCSSNFQT